VRELDDSRNFTLRVSETGRERERERERQRERERTNEITKETAQDSRIIILIYVCFSLINEYFTPFYSIIDNNYWC